MREMRIGFLRGILKAARGKGSRPYVSAMWWARSSASCSIDAIPIVRLPARRSGSRSSPDLRVYDRVTLAPGISLNPPPADRDRRSTLPQPLPADPSRLDDHVVPAAAAADAEP